MLAAVLRCEVHEIATVKCFRKKSVCEREGEEVKGRGGGRRGNASK